MYSSRVHSTFDKMLVAVWMRCKDKPFPTPPRLAHGKSDARHRAVFNGYVATEEIQAEWRRPPQRLRLLYNSLQFIMNRVTKIRRICHQVIEPVTSQRRILSIRMLNFRVIYTLQHVAYSYLLLNLDTEAR